MNNTACAYTKPPFYWECLGQHVPYDPSKKYLFYFCGCFSPPHKGHFDQVKVALDSIPNSKIFIHQIGDESRHGVPFDISQRIWRTYIELLLPRDRVTLRPRESMQQLYEHRFLKEADVVVILRGHERLAPSVYNNNNKSGCGKCNKCYHKQKQLADTTTTTTGGITTTTLMDTNPSGIRYIESKTLQVFRHCIRALQDWGKTVVFTFPDRPLVKVLSATRFTEALLNSRHQPTWPKKYALVHRFIPDGLPEPVASRIVSNLECCNLHVTS